MEDDTTYFTRRAREERLAATRATHPNAQARHLELAAAYEHRLKVMAAAAERRAEMHIVNA